MPPKALPVKSKKKGTRRRKAKVKKVRRFTNEELNEDFETFLTTFNPYMSENCVEFDRKSKIFKPVLDYRKPVVVFKCTGTMKRKLPEEIQIMLNYAEKKKAESVEVLEKTENKVMRNKFNFRSVLLQTTDMQPDDQGNQIDSFLFPVSKFSGTVSKAVITAAYRNHHQRKSEEKDQFAWTKWSLNNMAKYIGRKSPPFQDQNRKFLRLCERMVDQNLSEAHLDFSYYDNPNDEFRPNCGSLLPLWSFYCVPTKGLPVTGLAWSTHFTDLFAVAYRTFREGAGDVDEDDIGLVREVGCLSVYSLKGPAHPEKIVQSTSAVRCISFHPEWPHLLATGGEGGAVAVYDLRKEENCLAGASKMTDKILHQDAVSELRWRPDVLPQKFCTVSTDGKVLNWLFLLNDLFPSEAVTSVQVKDWAGETPPRGIESDSETRLTTAPEDLGMKMAGTSMSMNPHSSDLFVVGTDTGVIYECSFDEKSQLQIYEDHKHLVSCVHWNPFHPRVFLSCSDDMTVRIWDHGLRESIFEFFFDAEVRDACWAPFSSTLFAVISGNAVVCVYDLAVFKDKEICMYTVYTEKESIILTTLCFHPKRPILIVGDERGHVISFKLSPNLRSNLKAVETLEESKFIAGEVEKMDKLLAPSKGRMKRK